MIFLQRLGLHEVNSTLTTTPTVHTVVDSAVANPIVRNATSSTNVRRYLWSRDNKNDKL